MMTLNYKSPLRGAPSELPALSPCALLLLLLLVLWGILLRGEVAFVGMIASNYVPLVVVDRCL